jgi:hypothetical protein
VAYCVEGIAGKLYDGQFRTVTESVIADGFKGGGESDVTVEVGTTVKSVGEDTFKILGEDDGTEGCPSSESTGRDFVVRNDSSFEVKGFEAGHTHQYPKVFGCEVTGEFQVGDGGCVRTEYIGKAFRGDLISHGTGHSRQGEDKESENAPLHICIRCYVHSMVGVLLNNELVRE